MRPRVLGTAVAVAVLTGVTVPGPAAAFYGNGGQIVSADFGRLEQGDDTTQFAAISDDGGFVAFQTLARNFFRDDDPDPPGQFRGGGIFRFDLRTRALGLVADGDFRDAESDLPVVRGAKNPSVSASGRYVAFSTAQQLVSADTNGNVDVYVRDMDVPVRNLGAFDLISARDGTDVPAAYAPRSGSTPGLDPGSEVARGEAISADGNLVAFATVQGSDLPARATSDTPAGQILVRNRATNSTTLVTRAMSGGAPAGGAEGGAAISADGSTVAWTGGNASAQTPLLPGESTDSTLLHYLWRRVADGAAAPTRRVTGLADVDDPRCAPGTPISSDTATQGPCYGPLAQQEGLPNSLTGQVPALSGDGRTVAFVTGSAPRATVSSGSSLDLYVADMRPGVSRKAGTLELTREAPGGDPQTSSGIAGVSISSDGRWLGITTPRTRFILPALRFLGTGRQAPGARELYVADLAARTIERATRAGGGGDIDSDVANGVTLSADGGQLGFTSLAGNLFFGDGNSRADAFVATRQAEPGEEIATPPVEAGEGSLTVDPDRPRGPRVTARARSLAGGRVLLLVKVPAAGGVKAEARAQLGKAKRRRTIASRSMRARKPATVRIVLRPVKRYRGVVARRGRLAARVQVGYVAARGKQRLSTALRVTFRQKPPRKARKR